MNCSFLILFLLLCNGCGNGCNHEHDHGHGCGNGCGSHESGRRNCGCENNRNECEKVCVNIPVTPIMPIVDNDCDDNRRCREDRDCNRDRNRDCGREPNRDCGREPNRDCGREPNRDYGRDRNREREGNCGMTQPPWTRSNYSNGDTCGCEEK